MLHLICQQIWKTQQWPQDWEKVSFHSNPKEKEMQEGEVIAWGALQIAKERREAKGKGERERYLQLNAEF